MRAPILFLILTCTPIFCIAQIEASGKLDVPLRPALPALSLWNVKKNLSDTSTAGEPLAARAAEGQESSGTSDEDTLRDPTKNISDTMARPPLANMKWASNTRVTFDGHAPLTVTDIKPWGMALTGAVYATAFIGLHVYEANAWWRADRGPFHFEEDWPENLQNDKFGHFLAAWYISYGSREALLQCGLSDEAANDYGALMGGLYQLYVEVEDGYSTSWGFSPTDAYADFLGAAYFFAQYHIPILQNFREKWSYWPSQFLGSGSIPGQHRTIIDDYNGQSFWWAADVWNLLPADAQQWWPKWLELAVGYTAKKWEPYLGNTPAGQQNGVVDSRQFTDVADTREWYISFDYNLEQLIPKTHIPFIDWLVQTANIVHFPAPAIRLTPTFHGFLAYPFQLQIKGFWF